MKTYIILLSATLLTIFACAQQLESEVKAEDPVNLTYTTELVVPDLNIPWGMAFLPDNSILITEKSGELIHFKDGVKSNVRPKTASRL